MYTDETPNPSPTEQPTLPGLRIRVALINESAPEYQAIVSHPDDVVKLLRPEAIAWDRERLLTLALNGRNEVIGVETVSVGLLTSCQIHPREVFKGLILANAASFIVVHNHPSGDPKPSPEDHAATKKLRDVGQLIGIRMLDHIIIAPSAHYSFQAAGFL